MFLGILFEIAYDVVVFHFSYQLLLSQPDQRYADDSLINTIDNTQKELNKSIAVHPNDGIRTEKSATSSLR